MKLPKELSYLRPIKFNNLIRLGNTSDGGYVVPEITLKKIDGVISFGLNDDWSFEESLLDHIDKEINVHIYDHSVGIKAYFRQLCNNLLSIYGLSSLIFGTQKWRNIFSSISTIYNYLIFFKGNIKHFKNRVYNRIDFPCDIEIHEIFEKQKNCKNILLKMDIEGGEYRILDEILKYSDKVPIITCEFHEVGPLRMTFEKNIKELQKEYQIVHIHGNNVVGCSIDGLPDVLEITFINKNQVNESIIYLDSAFNSQLDFPNNCNKPDYFIEF
jgi:hypothetical protein